MLTEVYWQVIYWFSVPALAVLTAVIFRRGLHRRLPLFFAYALVACVTEGARFVAYHQSFKVYAYTYWISELVTSVFALLATYELFLMRIFPQFQKVKLYRFLFFVAAITVLSLAVLTAFKSIQVKVLFRILHGIDFLRVGMLFFFVALMLFMGRQWKRYEFGIALGFGVDAAAFVSAWAIFTRPGFMPNLAGKMPLFAYDIACVIWLITFLKPEKPELVPTKPVSPEVLQEARKWEETLKGSLGKKKGSD